MARLERHMAGAHSSYGTHHCILCGNRFKYDYNLLYHYRRSCPYTKAMIETDVREQVFFEKVFSFYEKCDNVEHYFLI